MEPSASATCIMNRIMGLLELYCEGLPPSRMPPCGAALAVLDAVAEASVFVTTSVTVVVIVAMMGGVYRLLRPCEQEAAG